MGTNFWNEFLFHAAKRFSVSTDTVTMSMVLLAILVLFSLGVVFQVMMIGRKKKISLRSAVSQGLSSLWAIPVLAVLACFGFRVMQTQELRPAIVENEQTDAPSVLPFKPTKEPPQWIMDIPIWRNSDNELLSMTLTARGANVADAERQLTVKTAALLNEEYPRDLASGLGRRPQLTLKNVQPLISQRFVQPGYETVGKHRNDVTQVYWRLDLSQKNRATLRSAAAMPRLWIVGGAVALLAVIVFGISTYLRLDAATEGKYRFRLKLATTTLICTAGLLLTALLPVA